ncbi:PhzF family phenazine biosynthesis protein [Arthrobacter sp. MDT2-2]
MTTDVSSLGGALRYAAFTTDPAGGNPAGVVLDASALNAHEMQAIATSIGYAETAFVVADHTPTGGAREVRYFSPLAEVPFCGHATIATAIALAEILGAQTFRFATSIGDIVINTTRAPGGDLTAAFTSVEPQLRDFGPGVLEELLRLLGLTFSDLHFRYPAKEAFAGNWHPVLVLAHSDDFDRFTFDPDLMRSFMQEHGWPGTVSVLVDMDMAENSGPQFEARNLFPVGTITEDPATGSAAAAFGGYLRALNQVEPPTRILIHQGRHVGRPSLLTIDIPVAGGIIISGTAVTIQ